MTPTRHQTSYLLEGAFYRLSWIEWGRADAPPVVCVHGLTRNAHDFDALAAILAADYRVICPDLPGRGRSEWLPSPALYVVPSYVQALSHLLAVIGGPVRWVGTSLGGICGMLLAAARNPPITRMVLNDIGPFIPKAALQRLRDNMAGHPSDYADLADVEARLRVIYAPFGRLTDEQWRSMSEHSARLKPDGRFELSYDPNITRAFGGGEIQDIVLWPVWQQIHTPTLVIRGAQSDLLDEPTLARMVEAGARSLVVDDAGHAPALMDEPTISAVRHYLDAGANDAPAARP